MREFLNTILGDEQTGNVAIALRDKPGRDGQVNRFEFFAYPQEFDKMVSYALKNAQGDVYFSPIIYGQKKVKLKSGRWIIARTPENAISTQVVYLDADTARPEDFRLPPSIVVESSANRFQCYWMLNQPEDAKRVSEVVHRITTAHAKEGSDQNSWSANKVLRIPYTKNTSYGFPEDVTVSYTGEIYSLDDISGAYDDITVVERPIMRTDGIEVNDPGSLPDYGDILDKLPERAVELALAEPRPDQDRSRVRYALLTHFCRETNLTDDEILSVAWHSPAARKWSMEDPRGIVGLAGELKKARTEVEAERGGGIEPIRRGEEGYIAPASSEPAEGRVALLTEPERKSLIDDDNWINRYVNWTASKTPKQNTPYARINAWTILSAALCDVAFIPRQNGPERLNLYTMTIGDTTTGKTAELKLMFTILKEIFADDPGYNIGGNSSASALGRKLQERDGKVSFFNRDEAHGVIKTWVNQDWTAGILEDLALLYDGVVPPSLRTGNWEGSGKTAETFFLMHLMGTPDAMIGTMNRDLFLTGFLARFIWAIGNPREVTFDSLAERDSDGTEIKLGFEPMARQFAAEFANVKRQLRHKHNARQIPVRITPEAARRMQEVKWQMTKMFEGHQQWDVLEPSLVRMGVTIRKAASLLALSEGKEIAELRHVLLAIEAAEEWVTNLLTVAGKISASDFERSCDQIEAFVSTKAGEVKKTVVLRRFRAIDYRLFEGYLKALYQQGRLREFVGQGNQVMIALTDGEAHK